MSAISESAVIDVFLADYASVEQNTGKANMLGVGGNVLPISPMGMTVRFSLVTRIHVPFDVCPDETSLEISLRDADGKLFMLSGPTRQAVRYATVLTLIANSVAVGLDQSKYVGVTNVTVVDFGNGMPLPPGNYSWHVSLDGDEEHSVDFHFCVPMSGPKAVVG